MHQSVMGEAIAWKGGGKRRLQSPIQVDRMDIERIQEEISSAKERKERCDFELA